MGIIKRLGEGGKVRTRMYSSARPSRLSGGYLSSSSADTELVTSLTNLRNRARQLVRDASYAKNGKRIVQNNVIGSGVGLQSNVLTTRGEPNGPVNDAIEEAFKEWSCADHCHTGGGLHFHDIERLLIGEVFEAGEIFVRLHYRAFGNSEVPLALEVIEPERIADEAAPGPVSPETMVRMGVEVDRYYRPIRYLVRERHQGEFRLGVTRSDAYEWVPADEMIHLKITERWPQTRGEPWLHTVVRKIQDIDGYSEAEIVAARGAANYFASIKMGEDPASPVTETASDGSGEMYLEPGTIKKLAPGEEIEFHTPNRPNAAMDPFMRLMLREVAAGIGVSYESLSRDYSQSNYSSSRLALLDDRDLWRYIQLWFIRSFRMRLHPIWLQQAVMARRLPQVGLEAYANDTRRYCIARYKPRGWSWIDPMKEVEAFAKAVRSGFMDVGHVISQTGDGRDLEDVIEARKRELEQMREAGLVFDTDPERAADGKPKQEPNPPKQEPTSPDENDDEQPGKAPGGRVVSIGR